MEYAKRELLEYLDAMCLFLANHHWTEKDERAVAIYEMIQNQPRYTHPWSTKLVKGIIKSFKDDEEGLANWILIAINFTGGKKNETRRIT